jgi:hypothetical protein
MDKQVDSYNVAVGEHTLPVSSKAPVRYQTSSSEEGLTGFQDLTPANPQLQARYDAMSPEWVGVKGTNKHVFNNSRPSRK